MILETCLSRKLNCISRSSLHNEQEKIVNSENVYVYANISIDAEVWNNKKEWIKCESLSTMIVQRNDFNDNYFFRLSNSYIVQEMTHVFVFYHQIKNVR